MKNFLRYSKFLKNAEDKLGLNFKQKLAPILSVMII